MALRTLGTNATTSLSAINFGYGTVATADFASLINSIKDDKVNGNPVLNSALDQAGILRIPNRFGWIQVLPGDFVGVDSTGWPILLSANAIANGPWTHT